MTQSIATTISVVICFEQEVPKFADIQSAIPFLSRCLHSPDTETIIAATTSFSSITACDHQKVMEADESIAPSLIGLLVHPREDIVVPALRAVGNIITGTDQETQRMIDLQVIPSLLWLLDYPNGRVRREALWTLSNITAGTVEHVQAVIDAGVIPKVVPLLKLADKEDEDFIKESCWLISNALASGSDDQVRYLIHENVVEAYCQLLPQGSKLSRLKLLKAIYDGLDKVLRFVKDHPSYIPSVLVLFEDYEVKNGLAVLMKRGAFTYSDCFLKISKCIEDLQKIVVSDIALTERMANLTTEN